MSAEVRSFSGGTSGYAKAMQAGVNRKFKDPCKSMIYKGSYFKVVVPSKIKPGFMVLVMKY
jgi:hypothetical protein